MNARNLPLMSFIVSLAFSGAAAWVNLAQAAEPAKEAPQVDIAAENQITEPAAALAAIPAWKAEWQKKLDETITLNFVETPLREVVAFLRDKYDLELQVDDRVLQKSGILLNHPITFRCQDIKLRSALKLILRSMELSYFLADESLVISTPELVDTQQELQVYPIHGLLESKILPGDEETTKGELLKLLTGTVFPNTWEAVGGLGTITERGGFLMVNQSRDAQQELKLVLDGLKRLPKLDGPDLKRPLQPIDCSPNRAEHLKLLAGLEKRVDLEFVETPLNDVLQDIVTQTGLNIHLDEKALAEDGVRSDAAVTFSSHKLTLGAALRRITASYGLTWMLQDEALQITTPEIAESYPTIVIYPVADLLLLPNEPSRANYREAIEELISDLQLLIAANTWDVVGGPGVMLPLTDQGVLIASQTLDIHNALAACLTTLRSEQAAHPTTRPLTHTRGDAWLIITYFFQKPVWQQTPDKEKPQEKTEPEVNTKLIAETIQHLAAPESWKNDERAYLQAFPDRIMIRQQLRVHKTIMEVLNQTGYHYSTNRVGRQGLWGAGG